VWTRAGNRPRDLGPVTGPVVDERWDKATSAGCSVGGLGLSADGTGHERLGRPVWVLLELVPLHHSNYKFEQLLEISVFIFNKAF
jgi:hypothetical protein